MLFQCLASVKKQQKGTKNNRKEHEKVELTRTETCLQKDYQKPRSKKNITRNKKTPKSSMIISSSMGRGVAHKMRTVHDTNCIGMVHPSAQAENLEESAKDMISTYKPDTVTSMGCTNNLSCGERPRAVISNIEHLVRKCRQANPSTKIVVSGLILRLDRPDLNNSITTINAVLKRNASNKDYTFMDNSNITYAHLKRDGLHLNDSGTSQLASNINKLVLSNTHFHNGHLKIHRDPSDIENISPALTICPSIDRNNHHRVSDILETKYLSVSCHNINRLYPKMDEIRYYLKVYFSVDIYGVVETFLDENVNDSEIAINNYNVVQKDRICRGGGGILIYVKQHLNYRRIPELELPNIEAIFIELQFSNGNNLVGLIYRPPNNNLVNYSEWLIIMDNLPDKINNTYNNFIGRF